jgi:hypothetical protein
MNRDMIKVAWDKMSFTRMKLVHRLQRMEVLQTVR